jgi:hypothetical protein
LVSAHTATEPEVQRPIALRFACPRCQLTVRQKIAPGQTVQCDACGWSRTCSAEEFQQGQPAHCLVCGCADLWRQKDFPQRLGLLMVGLGIVLSTIAYALWHPALSLGILMGFALVDFLLFMFMRDVLVCYRCGARHGGFKHGGFDPVSHAAFDLEVGERYRQERLRLEAAQRRPS